MCITIRVITGDYCSKSDSKEEDRRSTIRSFALRVDETIRKAIDWQQGMTRRNKPQLPWFCNSCDEHHYHLAAADYKGCVRDQPGWPVPKSSFIWDFWMNRKYVCMCVYSYFEKGCRIKCARQLRKVLWVVFEFIVFQGNLKEWQEKWVLKESNKSRFDSYSVRNSVLILSHITLRDCREHIFSGNLSRNSCMWIYKIT